MRTIRALVAAAAVVVALPSMAAAQQQHARPFNNAWFWGVKGGGLTYADSGAEYKTAPYAGIEWLITRTHGGLYVSAGEAWLTSKTLTFRDPNAQADSGLREINLKNVRKLDVAIMGFPGEHLIFHPYVGAGFTLNEITDAQPVGPFGNADQLAFAQQVIQDQKVGFSPFFIVGAQWRLRYTSVFAQASVNPSQKEFLLYNGRPFNFAYEIGLRYNVGSSIDRQ